jgi:hypothetical protein
MPFQSRCGDRTPLAKNAMSPERLRSLTCVVMVTHKPIISVSRLRRRSQSEWASIPVGVTIEAARRITSNLAKPPSLLVQFLRSSALPSNQTIPDLGSKTTVPKS